MATDVLVHVFVLVVVRVRGVNDPSSTRVEDVYAHDDAHAHDDDKGHRFSTGYSFRGRVQGSGWQYLGSQGTAFSA